MFMRRHWIRPALALLLGGVARPAWAQPPIDVPCEPVMSVVGRHRHEFTAPPEPVSDLYEDAPVVGYPEFHPLDPIEPDGGWFTGYGGMYWMTPTFQTNPAFIVSGAGGARNV